MVIPEMVVYIAIEVTFILLLILLVWGAILHKKNKTKNSIINDLKQNLVMLKKQKSAAPDPEDKNSEKTSPTPSGRPDEIKLLKIKIKKMKKEILNNKQQIANSQKYKSLYFKMENLLLEDKKEEDSKRVFQLEETLDDYEKIVKDLKEKLIAEPAGKNEEYVEQLERTIEQLEHSNDSLKSEMEKQKQDLEISEKRSEQAEQYRSQAIDLQNTEKRLNAELNNLKMELYGATEKIEKNERKLAEYKALKETFDEKEKEIEQLRNECETLGAQYHDLAVKSLENTEKELSQDEREELESVKNVLKETLDELERKRAECEMLEQSYLALDFDEELDNKASQLESSLADRRSLEKTVDWMANRAAELSSAQAGSELEKLKNLLNEKSEYLLQTKNEHEVIEDKIFNLSVDAPENANQHVAQLKADNKKLKKKIKKLQTELERQKESAENIKNEYNQLEKRYLAMAEERLTKPDM